MSRVRATCTLIPTFPSKGFIARLRRAMREKECSVPEASASIKHEAALIGKSSGQSFAAPWTLEI